MSNTPIQATTQEQISSLYSQNGEIVTQLEIGQARLMQINQQLNQLLGLSIPQAR